MKRVGAIISLAALIVVFSTSLCFAQALTLEGSYPENGATGASIENLGVKLYFSNNLTAEKAGTANENVFHLYDADGNDLPIKVLYPEKEDGVVLVLLDSTADADGDGNADVIVQSNSEYRLTISKDLVDDEGNVLGVDETVTFTTLNQNANTTISMLMMVFMFGGMMIFSFKSAKKANEEARKKKDEKVNPYKEAKRTGKSVEEIVEKDQREKAKRAAKEAAKAAKAEEWIDINTYRVKRPRPISEGGSSYITGRKAIAEAKKAEQEAKKAAKQQYRAKNVKKGKGKRKR